MCNMCGWCLIRESRSKGQLQGVMCTTSCWRLWETFSRSLHGVPGYATSSSLLPSPLPFFLWQILGSISGATTRHVISAAAIPTTYLPYRWCVQSYGIWLCWGRLHITPPLLIPVFNRSRVALLSLISILVLQLNLFCILQCDLSIWINQW